MSEKRCTKCGSTGPFRYRPETHDKLTYWCRDCLNAASDACRLRKLEHYREVNRRWRMRTHRQLQHDTTTRKERKEKMNDYPNSHTHWTEVDNQYLEATWGLLPDEEVMQTLGRTLGALRRQAGAFGLNKLDWYRTPAKLAQVLHIDVKLVRHWIARGKLGAERTHVRQAWHIPDEALAEFLKNQPYYAGLARKEHEKARRLQQQQYNEREDKAA